MAKMEEGAIERVDLIVLGRLMGTHEGWDGDMDSLIFYRYVPNTLAGLSGLIEGDLGVDLLRGEFSYYNDDGSTRTKQDAIPILNRLPKRIVP